MKNLGLYTTVLHSPLFKNGPIVIFIWENSEGWPVLDVSENIKNLYGYETSEYIEGHIAYADQIHPDDIAQVFEEVTQSSSDPSVETFEHKPYRYLAKDGTYHWVTDNTSIIRDENGEITHYIGYITDITEYVTTSEKLIEKNALYKKLFEISPVGLANNKMSDGSFVEINKNLYTMCGYTKEEFQALSYWDITPIKYKEQEALQLKSLKEKGMFGPYKKEYIHKDGHLISVLLNGVKHVDNQGEEYIWSVVQDITQLQEAFQEIRSKELKFTSIFENANEGISILKNGIFTEVNSKLLEMLECDESYLVGKSPIEISPEYQADGSLSSEKANAYIQKVLDGEAQVFDWQHLNAKGEIVDIEISLGFIPNGDESFVICLWRDISERIEILNHLKEAKEKADNASKLKSRFLANMSHEIRTPMNGILGFVDILAKDEKDERKKELYSHIKASGKSLLAIINDILDISKIESGKLHIVSAEFSASELFDSVAHLYKQLCEDKDIALLYERPSDFPEHFNGDDVRIKQVIINFLSNALKFTKKGGEIRYSVHYTDGQLTCSIKDSGTGIREENLEKIFNDFEQEDISTTRKYGGTGLGLSISSKLVSLMGGKIDVSSEFGVGSTFSFTIPLEVIDSTPEEEPQESHSEATLFHAHALIVEDNKTNQLLLSMLLEDFGVTYEIAEDGLMSLKAVEESRFDIIFMDENMPNMNGIEATKQIRSGSSENRDIPIIAVTANALSGDREKFLEAGMSEYLSKPYDDEDLKRVLQKYLI